MMVTADVAPLAISAVATPANVGRLRRALRAWLDEALGDDDAVENLTLAASEALENAVDHAFVGRDEPGTMTLSAHRAAADDDGTRVTVVIDDDGRWQAPTSPGHRGRGLELIDELTVGHRLHTSGTGTTVTLRHTS